MLLTDLSVTCPTKMAACRWLPSIAGCKFAAVSHTNLYVQIYFFGYRDLQMACFILRYFNACCFYNAGLTLSLITANPAAAARGRQAAAAHGVGPETHCKSSVQSRLTVEHR